MAHGERGKPHVVIMGGGFGGLYAARALRNADLQISLIDRHNYHLFQPLLYQVATAGLSPNDIAYPIRGVVSRQRRNTELVCNSAVLVSPEMKSRRVSGKRNPALRTAAGEFFFQLQDGAVEPGEKGLLGGVAVALIFQGGDRVASLGQGNVMAGDVLFQALVGNKLPEQAIAAGMAAHALADVEAGDGIAKQLLGFRRGAHGASVAAIPENASFQLQLFDDVAKVVRYGSLPTPGPEGPATTG